MADMPDLSHLTPEERAIIEGVMMRQRQEEQREHEIMRRKQDEVAVLEQTIRTRNEMQRAAGVELAATCHICLKTKFADGIGHSCHYCRVRCCARCGGKVTLRSNKVIWVCILCRKKQELLSKTGQWIHKGSGQDTMLWQMENDLRGLIPPGDMSFDKRPKLERAHSAAEKENLPLQRTGSALRRQYSQQEPRCYGDLECLGRTHPQLVHPRQKTSYVVDDTPQPTSHPPLPRSSSSDEEVPECVSDENDEYRDRGQLESCPRLRNPHLRSATVAAKNYYNLTNHTTAYEAEPRGAFDTTAPPTGGRSFDSATDCHWRARDDGEGAYLRPYTGDEGARPDRTVYKSAYLWEDSADSRRFTERRKKTVRFDGHEGAATFPRGGRDASGGPLDWASLRWESERQTSQDSATKDSGIDTSSTFTSSEDSNRGDCPKFPLSWQISPDGTRMVGHMVLRKTIVDGSSHSSAAILGLKVVGGRPMPDGTRGALVEKVKKGSIADIEGQLRIGDEVLQWNGVPLQGRTADEVSAVVADSKQDSHVELVVSRPIATARQPAQPWRTHKEVYTEVIGAGGCDKPSVLVTSPGSPDVHSRRRPRRHNENNAIVGGRIQLKVYFDISALQLVVTVMSASGLAPRPDGQTRCPYAKVFLLPDKSEKSKRRTKTLANTLEPRWNQAFVYCGFRITDIKKRTLEITVWDLNRYGPNDFLGEVLLDLDNTLMNHEPNWYTLKPHEECIRYARYPDDDDGEHLSPPSTSTSRLSDSDTPSECDMRRHHSLSSLASSSSPPPSNERMDVDGSRRSRRDMSPSGRVRAAGMTRDRGSSGSSSGCAGARSQSAAGARSKSPRRSLSPPPDAAWRYTVNDTDGSRLPTHAYAPRFQSRSATATPTTSPKKRQLPQIPHAREGTHTVRAQVSADLEERKWIAPHHIGATLTYRSTSQGWERHYAGLSDSDLAARGGGGWPPRRRLSPDATAGDSDLESVNSVTSSAFSTQSERPRPTRMLRKHIMRHKTHSSYDSATHVPLGPHHRKLTCNIGVPPSHAKTSRRMLPCVIIPLEAERAIRRRLRARLESITLNPKQRSRPSRRTKRISRSHSDGSRSRKKSCVDYSRSRSCPEYESTHVNTYKITENQREHIFHVECTNSTFNSKHSKERQRVLPMIYNEPFINVNITRNNTPPIIVHNNIGDINRNVCNNKPRRKLPQINKCSFLENSTLGRENNINNKSTKTPHNDNNASREKEIDIEILENVNKFKDNESKIIYEDIKIPQCLTNGNPKNNSTTHPISKRKKHLSLDLKSNYDTETSDIDNSKFNFVKRETESPDEVFEKSCSNNDASHKINPHRRYSDSVFLKCSSFNKTLPKVLNESLSITEKNHDNTNFFSKIEFQNDSKTDDFNNKSVQKNVVSIKNTPSYQEYKFLDYSFQRCVDLSLKEPLPSIIKKTRPRSLSLVSSRDHDFSNNANMLTALSPFGSSHRALTPVVASHQPDDNHGALPVMTATRRMSTQSATHDLKTIQSMVNQKRNRRNIDEGKKTKSGKKSGTKRGKRSNDYNGRENGRNGGGQQQPLERQESRRSQFTRSLSNADVPPDEKADGSLSDTALGTGELEPCIDDVLLKAEPRDYFGPGMGKKSNSTSQLSATGRKRRLGFGKRGKNSFTVQRSEEVGPGEMRGAVTGVSRTSSASSENDEDRWSPGIRGSGSTEGGTGGLSDFIDGLGPGQLVGRQVLGGPTLGDIQLSLIYQKGFLEVEVIRARGLRARVGSRTLPAPYVKLYMVNGKRCVAKAKTTSARRTLDPLYQQTLTFRENFKGCVLQVTVWGDYGRLEGKKVFMGVAQIMLDDVDLTNIKIGWYKLFGTTSL